jgi:PAS domain S-box-containing protein
VLSLRSPLASLASVEAYRLLAQEALLQATTEGVALVDLEGRYAFVNERLCQMLGYAPQELLGRALLDGVREEGREAVRASLAQGREGTDRQQHDVPLLRKDGSLLWVFLGTSPVRDGGGRTLGVLGVVIDVTARHRAEVSLRVIADASRALASQLDVDGVARVVAQAIDGGVFVAMVTGSASMLVRANACVDARTERRLQPLLGRTLPIVEGTLADQVLRRREPLLLGPEAVDRLHPLLAPIAREIGLGSVAMAPLLVCERAIGLMAMFRGVDGPRLEAWDLTLLSEIAERAAMSFERARLFEEQHRATERLRLLADAGTLLATSLEVEPAIMNLARLTVQWFAHTCAVQLFKHRGVRAAAVAAVDPALEEATRRAVEPSKSAQAVPNVSLQRVIETSRAELVREVDEAALRELAGDEEQLAALRELRLRSIIRAPLVARGRVLGVVTLGRMRGHQYDEDDLALAAELGRRAALAFDNARLFKRATDAISVRDEFLSIASHELNTPLTPLRMQLDTLRRGNFPPERVAEKIDAASRQVTRLTRLVAELLDVSRIAEGRLTLSPEPFDLAGLIDEVVSAMAEQAERAGSAVHVSAVRPCEGSWDRMRIDQVVSNLLSNAVKYGAGQPIDVELTCDAITARLVVRDRGIGIALDHQRRIFERFERATAARHYGGFGLGLWIVQRVVEASGGKISVQSAPRQGATFLVELPRKLP